MDVQIVHEMRTLPFEIDLSWDVFFLKQRTCQLFELQPGDYDICLEGKCLDEHLKLCETGVHPAFKFELIRRGLKNSNFVYCYTCEIVKPAIVTLTCDSCGFPDFCVSCSVDETMTKVDGLCQKPGCASTTSSVRFSCVENPTHQPVVALNNVKRNFERLSCIACLVDDCQVIMKFCDNQQHILCIPCFQSYSNEYLENGLFQLVEPHGFTLTCPAGCPDAFISDPHHFRMLGKDFYARYKEFAAVRYMNVNHSVVCPQCNHQWNVSLPPTSNFPNMMNSTWYRCQTPLGCGSLFCSRCSWYCSNAPPNHTASCLCPDSNIARPTMGGTTSSTLFSQIWSTWWKIGGGLSRNTDPASRHLIANTCRPCPQCRSATEKSNGCNHIHCSVCGTDWCWICCEPWSNKCQSLHWF